MRHRRIFYIPFSIGAVIVLTGCVSNGATSGFNTVTVTYISTDDGNFNDGIVSTKTVIKTVRKGVKWINTTPAERPVDPIHNRKDDGMVFDNKWRTTIFDNNGEAKEIIVDDNSSFTFNQDVTFTACYANNIRNFRIDTWDKVIEKAEEGFDALKQYYKDDYNSDVGKEKETFVGLERHITYAGGDYIVRVIDEKKDILTKDETKSATLTFEFKNALPGFSFNDSTESSGANKYKGSSVQKVLNSDVLNSISSFNSSHFQEVKKETYDKDIKDNVITNEKIFIASNTELNLLTDNSNKDTPYEGDPYRFYGNSSKSQNDRVKKYKPFDSEKSEIKTSYWTRSSDNSNGLSCWPIDVDGHSGVNDGQTYNSIDVNKALGVAPCFCIGVSNREFVPFKEDSWTNIVKTANRGYKALKTRYFKDWFNYDETTESKIIPGLYRKPKKTLVGLTHEITIGDRAYEARIIGENHDYLFNPNGSTSINNQYVAPITFELTTDYAEKTQCCTFQVTYHVIGGGKRYKNFNYFYTGDEGHTSKMHTFLNSTIYNKMKFGDDLSTSKALQPTYKQTHQASDSSKWKQACHGYNGWVRKARDSNQVAKYINESVFALNTFENGYEEFEVAKAAANAQTRSLTKDFYQQGYAYDYYDWRSITDRVTVNNVNQVEQELIERRKKPGYTCEYSFYRQFVPQYYGDEWDDVLELSRRDDRQVVAWNNKTGIEYGYNSKPQNRGGCMTESSTVIPCFAIGKQLRKDIGNW